MPLADLVALSNSLGAAGLATAILAEGNASCKEDSDHFWIKASGKCLETLLASECCKVRFDTIFAAMEEAKLSDEDIHVVLQQSTCGSDSSLLPSVETFMHAYLLSLQGIEYVGHTHPTSLLSILCLRDASEFAKRRLFPDEIVCCGPESVFVEYVDPGLALAKAIQEKVGEYMERSGEAPKTIWLQNHGFIALGTSPQEVRSATKMAVKAADITLGALQTGREINWLSDVEIARIHKRPDEHYRQRLLWSKD